MGMRDELIKLIEDAEMEAHGTVGSMNGGFGAWYANYLLAHGVTLPTTEVVENCVDCTKLHTCEKAKNVENYKLKSGCSEFESETTTNENIATALEATIKICNSNTNCSKCLLYSSRGCLFGELDKNDIMEVVHKIRALY